MNWRNLKGINLKGFIAGFGYFLTTFSLVEYVKGHEEAIPFLLIGMVIGFGFWKNSENNKKRAETG